MDNRIIFNQTFTSHYFDPTRNTRINNKQESLVDFYIFFTKNVSLDNICAFHVPYDYVKELSHASFHAEEEYFIVDILLHHRVVERLENPDTGIEELYLSILEYFCFGDDIYLTVNSYLNGGFGVIALFDEAYHKPSITSIVEPEVNKERFYYKK